MTHDVPPYAAVGGTPAKIIRFRFEPGIIDALLQLRWWNYGLSAIKGADFADVRQAIPVIERNIVSGAAELHDGPLVKIGADGEASVWRYDREKNELVACG